jgi:cell division ATPase FtsA
MAMIFNISSTDVKHEVHRMTKKTQPLRLTRPAEQTIVEHIIANPEFADALSLEAEALESDEPAVAARLNQWLEKAQYLPDKKTGFTRFDAADYLLTQEDMDAFLEACIEDDPGDGSLIKMGQDDIARATSRINAKR